MSHCSNAHVRKCAFPFHIPTTTPYPTARGLGPMDIYPPRSYTSPLCGLRVYFVTCPNILRLTRFGNHVILRNMPSENPETPLRRWMRECDLSAYEVARQSKISYKHICGLRDGKSLPSLVMAFKLDRVSGGKVSPSMWLEMPQAQEQWSREHDWDRWQEQRRNEQRRNRDRREHEEPAPEVPVTITPDMID